MTPNELKDLCIEALARGPEAPLHLVLPRHNPPAGDRVRLCATCGPYGRLNNVKKSMECLRFAPHSSRRKCSIISKQIRNVIEARMTITEIADAVAEEWTGDPNDYEGIRDCCDGASLNGLNCGQLDVLTDLAMQKIQDRQKLN